MGKIRIKVQPGASRNEVQGFQDDVLRVKLTAPPAEGKANKALIALLSNLLHVSRSDITVLVGLTGREKLVEIAGLTTEEIKGRLIRQ